MDTASSRPLLLLSTTSHDEDQVVASVKRLSTGSSPVQRPKRQIRLKRKQRDARLPEGHPHFEPRSLQTHPASYSSTSCRLLACHLCRRKLKHVKNILVFVVFCVAILYLAYLSTVLQDQVRILSNQIQSVLAQKDDMLFQHREMQKQLEVISSGQLLLKSSLTLVDTSLDQSRLELKALNGTVQHILDSLAAAPLLQKLPATVLQVQKNVADLGSRLTDLESQLGSVQKDNHLQNQIDRLAEQIKQAKDRSPADQQADSGSHDAEWNQILDNRLHNVTHALESRVVALDGKFKEIGTQLTDQLTRQESRAAKSWDVLGRLEDNIQNVSAKAQSTDALCRANQQELLRLDAKLDLHAKNLSSLMGQAKPDQA